MAGSKDLRVFQVMKRKNLVVGPTLFRLFDAFFYGFVENKFRPGDGFRLTV